MHDGVNVNFNLAEVELVRSVFKARVPLSKIISRVLHVRTMSILYQCKNFGIVAWVVRLSAIIDNEIPQAKFCDNFIYLNLTITRASSRHNQVMCFASVASSPFYSCSPVDTWEIGSFGCHWGHFQSSTTRHIHISTVEPVLIYYILSVVVTAKCWKPAFSAYFLVQSSIEWLSSICQSYFTVI